MKLWISLLIHFIAANAATEPELTFEQALESILAKSTEIKIQSQQIKISEAIALPVRFSFLPSVSLKATEGWTRYGSQPKLNTATAELNAGLNLFKWGADLAHLNAAHADIDYETEKLTETELGVEAQAVRAIFSVIQQNETARISQEIVNTQSSLLKIAQERFRGGYLAQQEVDKVAVDLENARATLSDVEIKLLDAKASLQKLLGHGRIKINWPWKERLKGFKILSDTDAEKALAHHPAIEAARARALAEDFRRTRDERLFLPSLDAGFAWGNYRTDASQTGWPGSGVMGWSASLTLQLPFFDRAVTYANLKTQSAKSEQAQSRLEQTERDTFAAWGSAKQEFIEALNSAAARDRNLILSRRIYQDNLRRFKAGRVSVNDLAIDQRRLFDTELNSVQGWAAAHSAFARLCHQSGASIKNCGG